MDKTSAASVSVPAPNASGRFWPEGWWKLMEFRIGVIPVPVFVLMGGLIAGFVATDRMSSASLVVGRLARSPISIAAVRSRSLSRSLSAPRSLRSPAAPARGKAEAHARP